MVSVAEDRRPNTADGAVGRCRNARGPGAHACSARAGADSGIGWPGIEQPSSSSARTNSWWLVRSSMRCMTSCTSLHVRSRTSNAIWRVPVRQARANSLMRWRGCSTPHGRCENGKSAPSETCWSRPLPACFRQNAHNHRYDISGITRRGGGSPRRRAPLPRPRGHDQEVRGAELSCHRIAKWPTSS